MHKKVLLFYVYLLAFTFVIGGGFIAGCSNSNNKPSVTNHQNVLSSDEKVMQKYCGSCHLPVEAKYLDKKTWLKHVLPAMAKKVGIRVYQKNQYYYSPGKDESKAVIPPSKWEKIVAYFKDDAPEKLSIPQNKKSPQNDWAIFSLQKPQWDTTHAVATTTLVAFDTLNHKIYSADASFNHLYRWNQSLRPTFLGATPSPPVNIVFPKDTSGKQHTVFTLIGTMRAVNSHRGELIDINTDKGADEGKIIANNIPRPVKSKSGDFNNDGLTDWIACGFGHTTGGLYEFEQQPDHQFKKKIIREVPGAIDVQTGDFNHDGWLDMMVLFAHAREGIWLFTNDHEGGFKSKNLLKFLPVYGSTSFELDDFNNDGRLDILYTAGDNADYSKILKPFHGVYIFLNKGEDHYKQSYFYHINGSTKAMAADFDKDGDLDISVISFFADLKHDAGNSFIYLEQDKLLQFIPHALPIQKDGRWISMDVGDFDGDHDVDVVLGNFSRGFLNQKNIKTNWNDKTPFILLKNKTNDGPDYLNIK